MPLIPGRAVSYVSFAYWAKACFPSCQIMDNLLEFLFRTSSMAALSGQARRFRYFLCSGSTLHNVCPGLRLAVTHSFCQTVRFSREGPGHVYVDRLAALDA